MSMNFIKKLSEKRIQKKIDAFNKSGMLRFFHYDFGRMRGDRQSFTVYEENGIVLYKKQLFHIQDGSSDEECYEIPMQIMQSLKYYIKDNNLFLLNGYNKSNSMIEGDSFVLSADFDNYKLRAEGASMLPTGFDEINDGILKFFEGLTE